ncbi:phosphatase PAP2 family protein [Nocardioides sp. SYSU D00065]|uniref:phosphatase PAP2 family protein n=1 Tax=Nocardioides sp. SYSU D00065 TaxID=2817378 RepID=UPI001B3036A5|nr:phosphatase PAP2 family protein [Nocardioides sp. SYSU D00065]
MTSGATARRRDDDVAGSAAAPGTTPATTSATTPADTGSRHGPIAQLLIAWSPLSAILLAYWVAQWITAPLGTGDGASTNRVGAGLHVLGPARADERLLGTVPSAWLQERLVDGGSHWYDAVAALVYVTHFVTIPLLTAVVWFAMRERFRDWLTAVLTMSLVGIAVYVLYPAAPPWLASQRGDIDTVDRISHLGWEHLGLDAVGRLVELGQGGSNPVAAMPSLHAGAALLTALFLWPSVDRVLRAALLAYAVAMAATLVYSGEHYVVDVAAGWLVAGLGVLAARARRSPRGRTHGPQHDGYVRETNRRGRGPSVRRRRTDPGRRA